MSAPSSDSSQHFRYAAVVATVAVAAALLMLFVFFRVQNLFANAGDPYLHFASMPETLMRSLFEGARSRVEIRPSRSGSAFAEQCVHFRTRLAIQHELIFAFSNEKTAAIAVVMTQLREG